MENDIAYYVILKVRNIYTFFKQNSVKHSIIINYTSTQNNNAKHIYQINLHVALRSHNLPILECEYPILSIFIAKSMGFGF